MKKLIPVLLILSALSHAESTLNVKRKAQQAVQPAPVRRVQRRMAPGLNRYGLTVLLVTPLGKEVFPELRFKAFGPLFLFSIPVWNVSSNFHLHAETGIGATLIKLELSQPETNFTHYFFFFPVHVRGIYYLRRGLWLEGYLGFLWRPTEYDSRPTTDGGFHKNATDSLNLDIGAGMTYAIGNNMRARGIVGYQHFGLGVEFVF
jgi:hypothetical protein